MKTIKQLADELGISKTSVRNLMDDDFRAKYTAKDHKGVITITPDGCKVISENFSKPTENTAKNFAETEMLTIPKFIYDDLLSQLKERDRQISDLTAAVKSQAQSINADRHNELAGTMQHMLPEVSETWLQRHRREKAENKAAKKIVSTIG